MAVPSPDSIVHVKCYSEDGFYRAWVEMLTPYHKLAPRERDVAARVLSQLARLRSTVSDPNVMWDVLWSLQSKRDMAASLGMSQDHFQLIIQKMRKAGFLVEEDHVNPKYIPSMTSGEPRYMLLFVYDWSTPSKPATEGGADAGKQD